MKKIGQYTLLLSAIILLLVFLGGCAQKGANRDDTAETSTALSVEDLSGYRIGVVTGTVCDTIAEANVPDCQVAYLNSNTDLAVALETDKIDAYLTDQPIARMLMTEYANHHIQVRVSEDSYGYVFPKNDEKRDKIREQMNAFLAKIQSDGTQDEIDAIWFGTDASVQTVDYEDLPAENGTLNFAIATDIGVPFVYLKDGKYAGYDVDIAARFCKEYGYGLQICDSNFTGLLASVSSGKCDFGASCITITDERKESLDFSDPNYVGGFVIVAKTADAASVDDVLASLAGKDVGVLTGSITDKIAEENIQNCQIEYYDVLADLPAALSAGKIDAFFDDEPTTRYMLRDYPNLEILKEVEQYDYAYIFQKDTESGKKLCEQMNAYLAKIKENGTMHEIDRVWFGSDEAAKTVDYDSLRGENGTVSLAVSTAIGAPFAYVKDGEYVGYDIDMAARFCLEYGYDLEILDFSFAGVLSSVASGKCDFGASGITVTEERAESVLFSDSNYDSSCVVVVKTDAVSDTGEKTAKIISFFTSLQESFDKTFVRENRWQLFAKGIGVTMIITILAALFGTILGFVTFLVYRKDYRVFRVIVNVVVDILEKTPMVVILMILYYIIFGNITIAGMWVSVFGFTLIFASEVIGLLKVGVNAVDFGQTEAALALGYTENQSFFRVVLPQAARHFLPGYKSSIVSLIKGTAIVGYIAVQDLTKVGDIVRSRTYEAFFPLIASALIYFVIAWILTVLVRRLEIGVDPQRRKEERILKGVSVK